MFIKPKDVSEGASDISLFLRGLEKEQECWGGGGGIICTNPFQVVRNLQDVNKKMRKSTND